MTHQNALFIVATPIGNLADISLRAIDVLRSVDLIAAEDTRHSARLLQHHDISTALVSYHDHGSQAQIERILSKLREGHSVALISDAGTPLISDPGYRLVAAARAEGLMVVPVPGACAFVAALSASGLPSDRIAFEGFPPAKSLARRALFEKLEKDERTLIFYESTHRISASLADMREVFGGQRETCVAREITKTFETFLGGTLDDVIAVIDVDHNQRKGEFVVLVHGYRALETSAEEITPDAERILRALVEELPLKPASALTSKITGEKKNKLYQWAIKHLGEH